MEYSCILFGLSFHTKTISGNFSYLAFRYSIMILMKLQLGFPGERYIYLPVTVTRLAGANPLTRGLYIVFLGHFVNAKFHYVERSNGSSDFIMLYCIEGKGWVRIGSHTYTIGRHMFVILFPNEPHSYGADEGDPWTIYWFHFRGDHAAFVSEAYREPTRIPESDDSRLEDRIEIFEEIYQALSLGQDMNHLCYASMCFVHFFSTILFDGIYRQVRMRTDPVLSDNEQLINRLTHFMRENIERKVPIRDFSQFLQISPSHLNRIFVRRFGTPPMTYFIRLKIEAASRMLIHSDLKIGQIAAKLGYSEAAYFCRQFAKVTGMSPERFRQYHRESSRI